MKIVLKTYKNKFVISSEFSYKFRGGCSTFRTLGTILSPKFWIGEAKFNFDGFQI